MSDFEKWFRSLNANGKTVYFLGNEHKVSEMAWNHQQAKIEKLENELSTTKQVLGNVIDMEVAKVDDLKTQLNNMEACYIEKKKRVEAVSQVLCELKESLKDFQEMDLYDKGHRVTTEYVIADLEQALRGAND